MKKRNKIDKSLIIALIAMVVMFLAFVFVGKTLKTLMEENQEQVEIIQEETETVIEYVYFGGLINFLDTMNSIENLSYWNIFAYDSKNGLRYNFTISLLINGVETMFRYENLDLVNFSNETKMIKNEIEIFKALRNNVIE